MVACGIEGDHRHPHAQRRGGADADACALREHARDHGRRWCFRARGRRLRGRALPLPARPTRGGRGQNGRGRAMTAEGEYPADRVVSDLDSGRLESLLEPERERAKARMSCSGVAIYATLLEELPAGVGVHSVVLPSDPGALYTSLEAGEEPRETMAFVNYYRGGEIYPNEGGTLAVLLTAPANGREYGLEDPFVRREIERVSLAAGLQESATRYFGEYEILDPGYFGAWGSAGGALYGAVRPFWRSGPLHRPPYNDRRRPWLWRVGAPVHPGGGIPAVLGGAMISTGRMLRSLVK